MDEEADSLPSLDSQVVDAIREIKKKSSTKANSPKDSANFRILPASLASSLGISIEDANAELCGLLRAVGPTATFTFELVPFEQVKVQKKNGNDTTTTIYTNTDTSLARNQNHAEDTAGTTVMVFSFPNDFEQKAFATRRKENMKQICWDFVHVLIKVMKIVVAFGLIISLAVVLIGCICVIFAFIVALSRNQNGGGRHHHRRLLLHSRSMWSSLRELLFVFSLARGFDHVDGIDPFVADIFYTISLFSPNSIFFWMRMCSIRNHRQTRHRRGWANSSGYHIINNSSNSNSISTNISPWSNNRESDDGTIGTNSTRGDERGILSIAVEFLFGPTQFNPGPSNFQKWKLREKLILQISSAQEGNSINLLQFLPFVDFPPPAQQLELSTSCNNAQIRSECLNIVTHFNGVPHMKIGGAAHFVFPELLMSESGDYHDTFTDETTFLSKGDSFLHLPVQTGFNSVGRALGSREASVSDVSPTQAIPEFLFEEYHMLTKMPKSDFFKCIVFNIANYFGLLLLWASALCEGGVLEIEDHNSPIYKIVRSTLLLLVFYAKLFFIIPLCRMVVLLILNRYIKIRNERRKKFAHELRQFNDEASFA